MPAQRYLPDSATLATMSLTMTHQQIADQIFRDTGWKVARSTISAALSRAGKTNPVRYTTIPWSPIKVSHNHHYALTMLRLVARREAGKELTPEQTVRLDSWLKRMSDEDAILAYEYDSDDGFYYVRRKKSDGDSLTRSP